MLDFLIVKPSSLGDIIHSLQVAQSIKDQVPGCTISWVVRDRFLPIIEACSIVDKTYIFHRGKGLRKYIELIKEIRKKEFDFVLDFQGLARTGVITYSAKGRVKIGRSDAKEGSKFCYDEKVPMPIFGKLSHAVEVLLEFLPYVGLEKKLINPVQFEQKSLSHIDSKLDSIQPIVVIPNSRQKRKEWPYFKDLTEKLLREYPNDYIVWDSHIPAKTEEFDTNEKFINTTGRTGVEEMISLVGRAKIVISNDAGPMHLAAAMGKPVLGLFGPTPPERFAPYPPNSDTNHYLQAPDCDLEKLDVDRVFDKVSEILSVNETTAEQEAQCI